MGHLKGHHPSILSDTGGQAGQDQSSFVRGQYFLPQDCRAVSPGCITLVESVSRVWSMALALSSFFIRPISTTSKGFLHVKKSFYVFSLLPLLQDFLSLLFPQTTLYSHCYSLTILSFPRLGRRRHQRDPQLDQVSDSRIRILVRHY